jgi:hypothetical protein
MDKLQRSRPERTVVSEMTAPTPADRQEGYSGSFSVVQRDNTKYYRTKSIKVKKTIIKFD